MGWDTTLVTRLRYYIGDYTAPYTHADSVLKTMLSIAAIDILGTYNDWNIDGPYTIDTDTPSITPDPTRATVPAGIGNLIVLRAAIILNASEIRTSVSSAGYKITDDKSSIDTTSVVDALKIKQQLWKNEYEMAKADFEAGNMFAGGAVLQPYNSLSNPIGGFNDNSLGRITE